MTTFSPISTPEADHYRRSTESLPAWHGPPPISDEQSRRSSISPTSPSQAADGNCSGFAICDRECNPISSYELRREERDSKDHRLIPTNTNSVPFLVKQCAQNTLTKHWTQRIPLLQPQSPAELAATVILDVFRSIEESSSSPSSDGEGQGEEGSAAKWKVVDFCSGSGGPIPHIEKHVNALRSSTNRPPIAFNLSDLYPNIDAWLEPASRSANLSFIPDSVDATNPPFAAISSSTPGDKQAALQAGYEHDGRKVLRTFCLAFHHFDDEGALRVLRSTLETSDAIVVFELQERRVGSCLLMCLEFFLVYLMTIFWFPDDWLHLILVYGMPVLPVLHAFDGLVSCLRTRTCGEFVVLLDRAMGNQRGLGVFESEASVRRGGWVFTNRRVLHTWPLGYMNATVGVKVEPE
jgi:hypothetical protein